MECASGYISKAGRAGTSRARSNPSGIPHGHEYFNIGNLQPARSLMQAKRQYHEYTSVDLPIDAIVLTTINRPGGSQVTEARNSRRNLGGCQATLPCLPGPITRIENLSEIDASKERVKEPGAPERASKDGLLTLCIELKARAITAL